MNGQRYSVERQKLCAWLESERVCLLGLADAERHPRETELEAEFRRRLNALYEELRPCIAPPRGAP